MANRISILVAGVLCGAGVMFAVQHAQTRPSPVASRDALETEPVVTEVRGALPAPAATRADGLMLAALERRLAGIEEKLATVGATAEETRRQEAERATASLYKRARPEDRNADQQTAFDRGAAIVEGAIRAGSWGDAEQRAIRDLAEQLLPADQYMLRNRLMLAGNQDRLRDVAADPRFF